ncbi:MAG: hypothetical protein Q8O57_02540, partial [Kiritimatiellota bacterium]|nr:hypothetical protein [Kiritimatiellota bacterium]
DRINILFVGRCAPNKRIEDALYAFNYFQKTVEPNARFIHVGSFAGLERYQGLLTVYARNLHLNQVVFAGAVPETLDGAGVLVREKRWDYIAEMMGQLTRRGPFREAVVRGQQQRLARYRARDLGAELKDCLAPLL